MPLFTVVINNYNYARYVGEAIESIQAQTFGDYELIVVDDGSSDGSLDVIGRYANLTLIRTHRLLQARACLRAIEEARGEFIYVLDADDIAEPTLLARAAEVAVPGVSKVQVQLVPVDAGGEVTGPPFPLYPEAYGSELITREIRQTGFYVTPQTSGNILAKRVYDLTGDVAYERSIDGVALLIAPFVGEVVSLCETLARYRLHGSNISRGLDRARFRNERRRFVHRLDHLARVLEGLGEELSLARPPREMFTHRDISTQERLHVRGTVPPGTLANLVTAARREGGLTRGAKLAAWGVLAAYGPRRVRSLMLQMRANPWSRLRSPAKFAAALLRRSGEG